MSDYGNAHAHLNIASGGTISDYTGLKNAKDALAIWFPAITSCQAYLQGSFDTTSANFFRLQNAAATSTFVLTAANGSKVFPVPSTQLAVAYMRIELSAAQTDNRSLVAMVRI